MNGIHCLAVDTDRYQLHITRADSKLLMPHVSDGGTAGDLEAGRRAAISAMPELRSIFEGTDLAFVLAGMCGGTGGGAGPVIADLGRRAGAVVVGMLMKPFHFERDQFPRAVEILRSMLSVCHTVILVDAGDQTTEPVLLRAPMAVHNGGPTQVFTSIVTSVSHSFANSRYLSADVKEFQMMLRRGGLATGRIGYSFSRFGAEEAALSALRHPIAHGDLSEAEGIFLGVASSEEIPDQHIRATLDLLNDRMNPKASILHDRCTDSALRGMTRVTFLATGVSFPSSWRRYRPLTLDLDDLEPEAASEQALGLDLNLHQLEEPLAA